MRTAPPAIKSVPRIIHGENTSPSRNLAKKAFQSRETAPRGASITTGREAIWTRDPRMLEEMKMAKPSSHNLHNHERVRKTDSDKERRGDNHGRLCSTRCSCSGKTWLRTWLLRWIVRPSDWTKEARRPMIMPKGMDIWVSAMKLAENE